jgi:peptide deformylase
VAVRPIRLFGDPVLRTPAEQVTDFDRELRKLVRDLTETMLDEGGAGLAAPQLGVGLRVFTYDVDDVIGHLVNPVLEFPDTDEQDGPEGCLSIPGLYFDTKRRLNVVARGVDMHGEPVQLAGSALMARCVQLDAETRKEAMQAIREAEWNQTPVPQVKLSPHPIFGKSH